MVSRTTISHRHKAGQDLSDALLTATAAVHSFARTEGVELALSQRLAVVTEELVTNLIEHAPHGRDVAFGLVLERDANGLLLALEDDSEAFDPRDAPKPDMPDPVRGGGVGLALVKAWTDIVSYDCEGGRNRLVLRFHPPDSGA